MWFPTPNPAGSELRSLVNTAMKGGLSSVSELQYNCGMFLQLSQKHFFCLFLTLTWNILNLIAIALLTP